MLGWVQGVGIGVNRQLIVLVYQQILIDLFAFKQTLPLIGFGLAWRQIVFGLNVAEVVRENLIEVSGVKDGVVISHVPEN